MKIDLVSVKNAALVVALTLTAVGCNREEITVYSAPKEKPEAPSVATAATHNHQVERPLTWQTPADWKELAPTSVRIGNLLVEGKEGKKAEVAITSFPGSVGSELDNWNRWRGEIGLAATGEDQIKSELVKVGSDEAKLYDMTGETLRTVVAMLPRGESTWFFKMRGDKEVVADSKTTFLDFLKTIEFQANDQAVAAASDPHAGVPGAPPLTQVAQQDSAVHDEGFPKLELPAQWKQTPPPPMVLKSYTLGDGQAKLAVSSLGGQGGGVLMNVNRWRGQLGLEPITEDELPKNTSSFDAGGSKAILVDITGTEVKTGKPARMLAAMVPKGSVTWFYKMTGDDAVVGGEKEAFIKVVQTARYE